MCCLQYIEAQVQQYLQQLAVKVADISGPPGGHGQRPHVVELGWLRAMHLLPPLLQSHYGSVSNFIRARPELQWVDGPHTRKFTLLHHAQLLAAADQHAQQRRQQQAAAGCSQSERQQQDESPDSSGGDASDGSDWPEYLQPQRHFLEAAAAANTAAAAIEAAAAARGDRSTSPAPQMLTKQLLNHPAHVEHCAQVSVS